MNAEIRVEGLARTTRAFRALDEQAPKEIRELNKRAGETVAATARPLAPYRGGGLLSTVKATATQRAGFAQAGSARVPYAGVVHYGWPAHGIEAQPFLLEAAGVDEAQIVADYEEAFDALARRLGF